MRTEYTIRLMVDITGGSDADVADRTEAVTGFVRQRAQEIVAMTRLLDLARVPTITAQFKSISDGTVDIDLDVTG